MQIVATSSISLFLVPVRAVETCRKWHRIILSLFFHIMSIRGKTNMRDKQLVFYFNNIVVDIPTHYKINKVILYCVVELFAHINLKSEFHFQSMKVTHCAMKRFQCPKHMGGILVTNLFSFLCVCVYICSRTSKTPVATTTSSNSFFLGQPCFLLLWSYFEAIFNDHAVHIVWSWPVFTHVIVIV